MLAPRSVDEVLDDLRRVGRAIGADDAGARAAEVMEGEREALRATREDPAARSVPVYLEWWPRPMFTPGADCFSNELIELPGAATSLGTGAGPRWRSTGGGGVRRARGLLRVVVWRARP